MKPDFCHPGLEPGSPAKPVKITIIERPRVYMFNDALLIRLLFWGLVLLACWKFTILPPFGKGWGFRDTRGDSGLMLALPVFVFISLFGAVGRVIDLFAGKNFMFLSISIVLGFFAGLYFALKDAEKNI